MLVLGINGGQSGEADYDVFRGYHHDAAAVIVDNGKVVAAIEEERLNRIKHTNCFPARSIGACLRIAGTTLANVDWIAIGTARWNVEKRSVSRALTNPSQALRLDGRERVAEPFLTHFGVEVRDKIRFVDHHKSHAWSAYIDSGFGAALVVSIDGVGDGNLVLSSPPKTEG